VHIGATWRIRLNRPCAAAMWPCVKLLWPPVVAIITALPMWRNGRPPQDIEAVEEDDVVFECNVIGRPNPTVSLTFNARPLHHGLPVALS